MRTPKRVTDICARAQILFVEKVYNWLTKFLNKNSDIDLTILNYGYQSLDPTAEQIKLAARDEIGRRRIQLYHHVASAIELRGKDVLEVGSGRGGGAAYLTQCFEPGSYLGVDLSLDAVEFCNRNPSIDERMRFIWGNAEHLDMDDASFDVIINIESSHNYPGFENFLSEVYRVLRPGGYFLFADFRRTTSMISLRKQLAGSGLEIVQEENITQNVILALDTDSDHKLQEIEQRAPRMFRHTLKIFAGIRGTRVYESFVAGDREYWNFILQKRR